MDHNVKINFNKFINFLYDATDQAECNGTFDFLEEYHYYFLKYFNDKRSSLSEDHLEKLKELFPNIKEILVGAGQMMEEMHNYMNEEDETFMDILLEDKFNITYALGDLYLELGKEDPQKNMVENIINNLKESVIN